MPPKLDGVCLSSSGSGTGGSGGSGGGGGSCQQFALQVMMRSHHHTFLSSAGGDVHDQDVQLQRALQEQKVTITQLNLAELELYGRDRELDVLQEALEEVLATGTTTTATVNATATANAAASKLDANASISSTTTNTTTTAGTTSTSATSTAVAVVQPHPLQVSSKTTPPPILLPRATTRGVVSIVGRAGTGKTRLTQEFKNTILKRRKNGLFLRGKFDLQNRKEPYAAVAAALSELPHQLESKGSAFKDKVWKRIQDAVGNDSHILTSLVPELSCVLGIDHERVPTDQFNYANLSHRLNYIFRQFMRALCCPDCPVVMVLDDMQWTDSSSLALVNTIIADPRLSSFLLVTTCREEEIGDKHIFVRQLQRWQDEDNIPVRTIAIGNLNQSAVSSIVSTALRSSEEKTLKLSEIVHQKTDGNAWYAIQFLRTLYDDGLLRYNLGLMQWMWEETMVRSQFVMDNVVDLAAAKIRRLPPDCQNVLQIASCLGRTFDLDHLEFVLQEPRVKAIFDSVTAGGNGGGSSEEEEKALAVNTMERHWPDDLVVCLKELVQESVIDFISQLNCYCFVHDLIQEAAFHLIPQSKSAQIQNEVGRCLLRSKEHLTSKRVGDQYYFRAIDLSNAGSDMLDDHEMLALAKCNLEAGEKAMEQAAFPSALKYMEQGFRCLGPEAWSRDAELALRLESGAVEAAYCCGDFESMEVHMASVLDRDDLPIHDKVRVYLTRILSYGAQDRNLEALQVGRKVLREMKVTNIPLRPTTRHLIVELLRTKFLLRNHTPESLLALPKLESKKWLLAMSVVDMMTAIAYVFDINVFTVMNLRTLRWSVTHGVCRYSPTIFSTYGVVLSSLGDVKIARMYGTYHVTGRRPPLRVRLEGRLCVCVRHAGVAAVLRECCSHRVNAATAVSLGDVAISLSQRLNARASVAKTIVCIYGLNYHWTSNLRICLKPLMYGHKVGMESGEVRHPRASNGGHLFYCCPVMMSLWSHPAGFGRWRLQCTASTSTGRSCW